MTDAPSLWEPKKKSLKNINTVNDIEMAKTHQKKKEEKNKQIKID